VTRNPRDSAGRGWADTRRVATELAVAVETVSWGGRGSRLVPSVRRDLRILEQHGLVWRSHGWAR
jgi:hypothetical protein